MINKKLVIYSYLYLIFCLSATGFYQLFIDSKPKTDPEFFSESNLKIPNLKRKVTIGILDTGVDITHPFLIDHLRPQDLITKNIDPHGHGTHITGIIISNLNRSFGSSWVKKNVEFHILKYNINDTDSYMIALKLGINKKLDYINFSGSGVPFLPEEYDLIRNSTRTKFIVASGNEAKDLIDTYPCSYGLKNIICVGNVSKNQFLSRSSNTNKNITYYAVGTDVYSTLPYNKYGWMSGTSQSAPLVLSYLISYKISKSFKMPQLTEHYQGLIFDSYKTTPQDQEIRRMYSSFNH